MTFAERCQLEQRLADLFILQRQANERRGLLPDARVQPLLNRPG